MQFYPHSCPTVFLKIIFKKHPKRGRRAQRVQRLGDFLVPSETDLPWYLRAVTFEHRISKKVNINFSY